jgi:pimeloyl-ACP methyl ester carboxylesterase
MWIILSIVVVAVIALGGAIAFGTGTAPPPMRSLSDPFRNSDFTKLPAPSTLAARDGVNLTYRYYPTAAAPERVVILIHGSTASSVSMHPLAAALNAAKMAGYTLDIRGHGDSGQRGVIGYPTQLDDDLADVIKMARTTNPATPLVLAGFSAGGGFSLHSAGTSLGKQFERIVLLSPMLGYRAPTTKQEGSADLVTPFIPRIIALTILNKFGVHAFDHLQTLAFGDFQRKELTPSYSFGLMKGFATSDYANDVRTSGAPLAVVIGANDEFFDANAYAPTLDALRPGIPVTIVPGLTHIGLITDETAVPAILTAVRGDKSK